VPARPQKRRAAPPAVPISSTPSEADAPEERSCP
jgi:hypothetical protein